MATHEAQLRLEEEAHRMGQFPEDPPSEHQIELSKAISLKRIADALDGAALGVDVSQSLAALSLMLERRLP